MKYSISLIVLSSMFFIYSCQHKNGIKDGDTNESERLTEVRNNNPVILIEKDFPEGIAIKFIEFRNLVEAEEKSLIAKLIPYPLKRPNELIQNEEEFIAYYENIFDESLKKKIRDIKIGQQDFIIKSDHYGILGGMLWFNRHSGEITSLRYQTEKEKEMAVLKKQSIKERDHESISGWDKAIVRCETENYTIYILEYPSAALNYVSWNKPKTSSDKPDLRLKSGKTERKGTMGGSTYSFQNGIWSYAIDERRMGPTGTNGFFLQVFKNDNLVKEEKAKKLID